MGVKLVVESLRRHPGFGALWFLLMALTPLWAGAAAPSSDVFMASSHGRSVQTLKTASIAALSFTQLPYSPIRPAVDVAVADLNGDGKLDVLRSNFEFGTHPPAVDGLEVLLGNGDGTLVSQGNFYTEAKGEVALGQLDGDGLLDLATAAGGYCKVFKGNGDGTFGSPKKYRVAAAGAAGTSIVNIGDLNADGRPDIVGSTSDAGQAWVLLASNSGGYKHRVLYTVGSSPRDVAIADLNQDGRPDLVVSNFGDGTISVLRGNGDGTFQAQTVTTVVGPSTNNPRDIEVTDLNGDGMLDIAVTIFSSGVSVLLGNGDGTFGTQNFYDLAFSVELNGLRQVAIGDLDSDGILDLGVASLYEPGGIHVLLGHGDGTFTFAGTLPVTETAPELGTNSLAIANLNGDALPDVVADTDVLLNAGVVAAAAGRGVTATVDGVAARTSSAGVSPNPLRGVGTLGFTLPKAGPVSARLFDTHGRLVGTLRSDSWAEAGRHELTIDRRGLAPGIYLYRIDSASGSTSGRVVVVD